LSDVKIKMSTFCGIVDAVLQLTYAIIYVQEL